MNGFAEQTLAQGTIGPSGTTDQRASRVGTNIHTLASAELAIRKQFPQARKPFKALQIIKLKRSNFLGVMSASGDGDQIDHHKAHWNSENTGLAKRNPSLIGP